VLLIIKNQIAVSTHATSKTYAAVRLKAVSIFTLHLLVQAACSIALQQKYLRKKSMEKLKQHLSHKILFVKQ